MAGHLPLRAEHPRAESRTAIPPAERVSFALVLRYPLSQQRALDAEASRLLAGERPAGREAAARRSADVDDLDRVRTFCEQSGLTIDAIEPASRSIRITAAVSAVNALFHIVLVEARAGSTHWREYDGVLQLPAAIDPIVEAVLGLATTPIA